MECETHDIIDKIKRNVDKLAEEAAKKGVYMAFYAASKERYIYDENKPIKAKIQQK